MSVPASLVKELREQTGAGMMDCRRALEETGSDLEAARRLLRERGMAQAAKRAGRATSEGLVGYRIAPDGRLGTMVAVGCETEPVSRNDEFQTFAQRVLEAVEAEGPDAVSALEVERQELVGKISENIVVVGAARYDAQDGEVLAAYVHPPANKIGVLVKTRGATAEAARQLAMHIAFAGPRFLDRTKIPDEEIATERAIYEKQPDVQAKPEHVRPKIVEGMLAKRFFAEHVLGDQQWIHEPGKTVGQALEEQGVEVLAYDRYALGR